MAIRSCCFSFSAEDRDLEANHDEPSSVKPSIGCSRLDCCDRQHTGGRRCRRSVWQFEGLCSLFGLGLLLVALLGLSNAVLLKRSRRLARWYKLRTAILVLGEAVLVFHVVVPAMGVYDATHPAAWRW